MPGCAGGGAVVDGELAVDSVEFRRELT